MIHMIPPVLQLDKFSPFVYFEGFLKKDECFQVSFQMKKLVDTEISEGGGLNKSIRSTKGCALEYNEKNKWLFDRLSTAIVQANHDIYGYDILGFNEAIQLLEYGEGDFYDWHMDFGNKHFSQRKLSVVIQLTDPKEYEGGELEFFKNGEHDFAPKTQGTLIMFPSFMYHKVNTLKSGRRRSLVAWINGHPYR